MRHKDVVFLITRTIETDEYANQIPVEHERMIFANEMSVSISEFYEAGVSGMKPEKQFEVQTLDYSGESSLRHNAHRYNVVRTALKGDKTRIICERVVGHVNNTSGSAPV